MTEGTFEVFFIFERCAKYLLPLTECISISGCHNKIPQNGWHKQQKLIFSEFWRLEGQDQGLSRVGFW